MSWDDDSDADAYGARRPVRAPRSVWRFARRTAGYIGAVVGVVALVIGAIAAVNVIGTAANPDGFAAPPAFGPKVAPPPVATPDDREQVAQADGETATDEEPTGLSTTELPPMPAVDSEWLTSVAAATGIPERALSAYALAHITLADDEPDCGLDWTTIAAIGEIESGHGSHGSTVLDSNGNARPPIIGPALDGSATAGGVARIADTDQGRLDGDATWDRAVGPMQFIPSTWSKWGSDGNGDDVADPNQIDDAALSAGRYLCASGAMTSAEGWRAAVFSYNHDNDYVDKVARLAREYADAVA